MNSMIYEIAKDAVCKGNCSEGNVEEIVKVYDRIVSFCEIARREGLLALEEEVCKAVGMEAASDILLDQYSHENLSGTERLLTVLIGLIIDGTDPEMLEQIAIFRYFSANYEGTSALAACLVIIGALAIQAGENPRLTMQKLLALLPKEIENRILKREKEREQKKNDTPEIPVSFFVKKNDEAKNSPLMESFTRLIFSMEDFAIQRVVREIDYDNIAICLKGADGEIRKRFFDNMSKRMCGMVYESICGMEPIRMTDAEEAAVKIMKEILKLKDSGEIVLTREAFDGRTLEEIIALQEHKILCGNREIEYKIKELQAEISRLERQIVKL